MASGGTAAFGTTISINGTPIGGVQDISGPDDSYDWDDTSSHSSPNRTEEGVPTIRRTGEVSFSLVIDSEDSGQAALLTAHDAIASGSATPDAYVITYPDGETDSFSGYCMRFGRGAPVGGHLAADVTIRPTGAVTYSGGS
jgi:hypothetical protein